jgi:hypothetical protein
VEGTRANDLEVRGGDKELSCEGEMSTVITRPFPLSFVLGVMGLIPCEGWRGFARDRCVSWRRSMTGTCSGGLGVEETLPSRRRTSSWGLLRDDSGGGVGLLKAGDWCHCLDKRFGETSGEEPSGKGCLCLDREDESLGCPWFSSMACERGNGKGEGREAEKHRFSFRGIPGGFVSRV